MKRLTLITIAVLVIACSGTGVQTIDAEIGNGDAMESMWRDFSIFPKLNDKMLKKMTPEQIVAYFEAASAAMDSLAHLEIRIEIKQDIGTTSEAQTDAQITIQDLLKDLIKTTP